MLELAALMYEHHFIPLAPGIAAETIPHIRPLHQIAFTCQDGTTLPIWILGRSHTIDAVAISLPMESRNVDRREDLQKGFQHIFVTLRLAYDCAVDVFRTSNGFITLMNRTESEVPAYEFPISASVNENHAIDLRNIENVFHGTNGSNLSSIVSLLGESQAPQIPPHYQFLALYRALEFMFANDDKALTVRINSEAEHFAGLMRDGQTAAGAMAELRNRCAHGKSRGEFIPLSGLLYNEPGIGKIVAIFQRIVANELTRQYGITIWTNEAR